jgi:tetratricopeptide (TPR) repeat protein
MTTTGLPLRALALFDALVELDPDAQAQRLQALHAEDPALHAAVAALLAADRSPAPALQRDPASLLAGTDADDDGDDAWLGRRIGPWRITAVLGRGGMGAVYLGEREDGEFQQQAAVKRIRLGMDRPELRRRFLQERQILARLQHPNIATLLDGGVDADGAPYFAMERVEGTPIDRWCDGRQLGLRERVRLFLQVCDAVQHAHRNLTVHRDLKPGNILVTADGRAKLLDFGIAKLLEAEAEGGATVERPFTPEYAAPEQSCGEAVTTATDVYALGLVLYRLLADAHPSGTSRQALADGRGREPEPLPRAAERIGAGAAQARGLDRRALAAALRGDLNAIVMRCLQDDPARRYSSAEALGADLKAWLDGLPVAAARGDRLYRIRKFTARHRWGVAAAAIALLAIAGTTALALQQAREAREQARLAQDNAQRALENAARAENTTKLVVDMFTEASPTGSRRGTQLTAAELLRSAATRIERELADMPGSQAELYYTVGMGLANLDEYEDGVALIDRSLAQMEALGMRGQLPATALINRAVLHRRKGELEQADARAREALAELQRADVEIDEEERRGLRVQAHAVLATTTRSAGRYQEALELLRQVLDDRRAILGDDDPGMAVDWNNLGTAYLSLDRYAEAEAAFDQALRLLSAQGRDHPRLAWVHGGLARARMGQGDRLLRTSLSPTHSLAVNLNTNRATLHRFRGEYAQAEAADRRALALISVQDPDGGGAYCNLGLDLLAQERYEEASRQFAAGIEALAPLRVPAEPHLNRCRSAQALVLFRLGRGDASEGEIRAARQRVGDAGFTGNDDYAEIASDLAALLQASGRAPEAQPLRLEAYRTFARVYGGTHPRTRRAQAELVSAGAGP